MVQGLSEYSDQFGLVFVQMVNDVREQPIEDLKGTIDLEILFRVHEQENEVKKVLPDLFILFVHSSGNFDEKIC